MPYNNTYLSNLDKERKRLIKVDFNSIDVLTQDINSLEDQIDNVEELTKDSKTSEDLISNAIEDFKDVLEKLNTVGILLRSEVENYEEEIDRLEDAATMLDDLVQMKTKNDVDDFDKNAEALGINAKDISQRNTVVELNDEAKKSTSKAYGVINKSSDYLKEAQQLIKQNIL